MATSAPFLCGHCADVDTHDTPTAHYYYELQAPAEMIASAATGCQGCAFFSSLEGMENFAKSGYTTRIFRCGENDSRAAFEIREGEHDVRSTVDLRICSTDAFEAANWAEKVVDWASMDPFFPGRRISSNSGDKQCLDLASSWYARCTRYHSWPCVSPEDKTLPTRLIHIRQSDNGSYQLKLEDKTGQNGRYVALSHCWGKGVNFKTTNATLSMLQAGFDAEEMPRSFRDAVHITFELGFEYLWIDALCIIQDGLEDWSSEASRMATVYGDAELTICADLAENSNQGILGPRNIRSSHVFGKDGKLCLQVRNNGWREILDTPLTYRGWAFQERFLSRRKLHYFKGQIAWECPTGIYLEEYRGRHDPRPHFGNEILNGVLGSAERDQAEASDQGKERLQDELTTSSRIALWSQCIEEWSERKFTHETDRLPSLSGLASALQAPDLGRYLAGHWEHDLFTSLSWFHRHKADKPWTTALYQGPSWSWASARTPVAWLYPSWADQEGTNTSGSSGWAEWSRSFGPKLLGHQITPKSPMDPKGEVEHGSHLVIRGSCQKIFIQETGNPVYCSYQFRFNEECEDYNCSSPWAGKQAVMDAFVDIAKEDCGFVAHFPEDLESSAEVIDNKSLRQYTCVQLCRVKNGEEQKVVALILEPAGELEDTFARVGLLKFDDVDATAERWTSREIKLV